MPMFLTHEHPDRQDPEADKKYQAIAADKATIIAALSWLLGSTEPGVDETNDVEEISTAFIKQLDTCDINAPAVSLRRFIAERDWSDVPSDRHWGETGMPSLSWLMLSKTSGIGGCCSAATYVPTWLGR